MWIKSESEYNTTRRCYRTGAVATGSFRSTEKTAWFSQGLWDDPVATAPGSVTLLQLFVFLTGGDENGNRAVGVPPEREEILICSAGFRGVAFERGRPRQTELRQRIKRREWIPAAMVDYGLKFLRRLSPLFLFQVSLATQGLRPEFSCDFVFA